MTILHRLILAAGLFAALAIACVPPWEYVAKRPKVDDAVRFAGWFPVWTPPVPWNDQELAQIFQDWSGKLRATMVSSRIDTQQLMVQELIVIIATAGLFVLIPRRKPE